MNFPACTTLLCGIVILVAVVGPVAAAGASDGVMTRLTRITFTGSEAPLMDGLATVMVIIIFAGSLINVVDFVKRFTVGARVWKPEDHGRSGVAVHSGGTCGPGAEGPVNHGGSRQVLEPRPPATRSRAPVHVGRKDLYRSAGGDWIAVRREADCGSA
ncbi:uncharacterized protein LOC129600081 [Paramacrobiotus metropolitanus]|uniref:uncharacterized protein LOC129600081 n=1 Tax=Paramacrobiotus metropolitanus TaxID=2943436 RepID=UPI0024460F54|nr:uncharacterized protein LOC129600081 [Paramacrobiotus metropolitanus]